MRYLVDTNVWIDVLKGRNPTLRSLITDKPANEIFVCSVVWAELIRGSYKYGRPDHRLAAVRETLRPFESLPFDDEAAAVYGVTRHALEVQGQSLGSNDLMIASIAIVHDLIVASHDYGFTRIEGLRVEDWQAG